MSRCHSKGSLLAAAAVGVLILASGGASFAQSLPSDSSVSRNVAGQDAKMSAVLDSLKSAGLAQANLDAVDAAQVAREQARVSAQQQAQAQVEAAQAAAQAATQTQAGAPVPAGSTTTSSFDALKAAGIVAANQNAVTAAQVAAQQARVNAQQQAQAQVEAAQAAAQTQAGAPQQAGAPVQAGGATQSSFDALKAAGIVAANQNAVTAAQVAAQQARVDAQQQAQAQAEALANAEAQADAAAQPHPQVGTGTEADFEALKAAGRIVANQRAIETAQEEAEVGRVAIEQGRQAARQSTQEALQAARQHAGAALGQGPALHAAAARASNAGARTTAGNIGRGAPRNGGSTAR